MFRKRPRWSSSLDMSVLSSVSYPSRPPQKTYPCPPRRCVISTAFLTWLAAYAKTAGAGFVAAPAMKRRWEKALVVPQRSLISVSFCSFSAIDTILSSRRFVSSRLSASGAMSRSWKHQKSTPSLVKNSNAADMVSSATFIGSEQWLYSLSIVPGPKGSAPSPLKLCQ